MSVFELARFIVKFFAAVLLVLVGVVGALIGVAVTRFTDLHEWEEWQQLLHLEDLPAFVVVSFLHWSSYLGGLLGPLMPEALQFGHYLGMAPGLHRAEETIHWGLMAISALVALTGVGLAYLMYLRRRRAAQPGRA